MGRFTKISADAFEEMQLDAGILLTSFTPATPTVTDSAIVCATTGGINATCVPTYEDIAEDVDNAPTNLKEYKKLTGWECKLSTTGLGTSPSLIKLALGAGDIDSTDTTKITPRVNLALTDFSDLWWVGDRADGGFVAIQIKNALSTGGFNLQTTKNGKGQVSIEFTGHPSSANQSEVPMVFYSVEGE